MTGQALNEQPPGRDSVVHFMEKLTSTPQVLAELRERFVATSVGMARALGNLTGGAEPNWAAPVETHTIYGDGTYVKPFSDVRNLIDPISKQRVVIGSRATVRKPRLIEDAWQTQSDLDGKAVRGINHVAIHTRTRHGRVVLAVGQAYRAEAATALELIDRVAAAAGDGIHTLVYDRAVTGWYLDYLMARHRIQTIGKAVARPSNSADGDEILQESLASPAGQINAMKRLAAEHGAVYAPAIAPVLRPHVLRRLLEEGGPMPVGTSCYPTMNGMDVIRGKYFWLPDAVHDTPSGPCSHRLAVDDGALYTIGADPEHGWAVKTGQAECITSIPHRIDGAWTVTNTWTVPCPAGAFEHTTVWKPPATRGPAKTSCGNTRTNMAAALRELRPLSRADGPRFQAVFGRRNDSESFNNWTKRTLSYKGRAASLRPLRQDLDFLAAALLNNSATWQNSHTS